MTRSHWGKDKHSIEFRWLCQLHRDKVAARNKTFTESHLERLGMDSYVEEIIPQWGFPQSQHALFWFRPVAVAGHRPRNVYSDHSVLHQRDKEMDNCPWRIATALQWHYHPLKWLSAHQPWSYIIYKRHECGSCHRHSCNLHDNTAAL